MERIKIEVEWERRGGAEEGREIFFFFVSSVSSYLGNLYSVKKARQVSILMAPRPDISGTSFKMLLFNRC